MLIKWGRAPGLGGGPDRRVALLLLFLTIGSIVLMLPQRAARFHKAQHGAICITIQLSVTRNRAAISSLGKE